MNSIGSPAASRNVLITGASRGIGAHLTRGFLAAGWRVVGISRTGATPEGATADDAFTPLACDVTNETAVADAVAQAIKKFGRIDVLVNNAGLIETEQPLWQANVDEWWGVLEANVKGTFLMSRAVVPHMIEAGGGRVVDMNSGAGTKDTADLSAYNASKSALFRITGSLHRAGAEHGIKAFDVAPGVIETDMTHSMDMHVGRTQWTDPRDLVALVLALASGELDEYSGRMVRAGVDSVDSLRAAAERGLSRTARTLGLFPYGDDDPVAG